MKIAKKIVIVGLGLIGGSLALVLKKKRLANEIVGVSRSNLTLAIARKIKAVDWCTKDLALAFKGADLIIFAVPVQTIIDLAKSKAKFIPKDAIVSDVGSSKQEVVKAFESKGINFIGAHPLAGSEKHGIKYAASDLFADSLCILTPTKRSNRKSLAKISRLWQTVGAKTKILTPDKHDTILALTSHLPHVIAFSLVDVLPEKFLKLAPASFRDITRVAASSASIWEDIFLSNRKFLLSDIDKFQARLNNLKKLIRSKDKDKLFKLLDKISRKRSKI